MGEGFEHQGDSGGRGMTKKELIEAMAEYPDDIEICYWEYEYSKYVKVNEVSLKDENSDRIHSEGEADFPFIGLDS